MTTNQYLDAVPCDMMARPREKVIFADGFEISIQASQYHYCIPRVNFGPYDNVELGFPSEEEPRIADYAEDRTDLTRTVYGYVPVEIVDQLIKAHGGITYPVINDQEEPNDLGEVLEFRKLGSFDEE